MAAASAPTTRAAIAGGRAASRASRSDAERPSARGNTADTFNPIRAGSASSSSSARRRHWSGCASGSHAEGNVSPTA